MSIKRFLRRVRDLGLFRVFTIGIQIITIVPVVWLATGFLHREMDGSQWGNYVNGVAICTGLLSASLVEFLLNRAVR